MKSAIRFSSSLYHSFSDADEGDRNEVRKSAQRLFPNQKVILFVVKRHYAQPPLADQRRIREGFLGLDFGQGYRLGQRFSAFDLHLRISGVGRIHGNNGGPTDGTLHVASLVNNETV